MWAQAAGNLGLGTEPWDKEGPLVDMRLWRITASTSREATLARASPHL